MYGVSWEDPECLHSVDEAIEYIKRVGFLPLFKNDIPGFSLEERTVPEYWWCENPKLDPWIWREIITRDKDIVYGKFFNKKAGFITREWLPDFANYRRDGYDFDALWDDEKASIRQKKIMDLFTEDRELYSFEIKQMAGFSKNGEKNFEGTIADLQMHMYLCMCDFRKRKNKKDEEYGMAVSVFSMPEHVFSYDHVTSMYNISPEQSKERLINHIKDIYPIATEKQIGKIIK